MPKNTEAGYTDKSGKVVGAKRGPVNTSIDRTKPRRKLRKK